MRTIERVLRVTACAVLGFLIVGRGAQRLRAQDKAPMQVFSKDNSILSKDGQNIAFLPPTPPTLSDVEKLKVENLNLLDELRKAMLEADTCRGQIAVPRAQATQQQITASVQALEAAIESAHPGYTWDPASGTFTAKPPAAPPETKP